MTSEADSITSTQATKRDKDEAATSREYRYGLAVTSQFYFCGLPLRLDTYSKCAFRCSYCFAHARGGAHRDLSAAIYSANRLSRRFDRIRAGRGNSVVDELLSHGQPIHFGGMSDPFSALEVKYRASLAALQVLADNQHPTVISTKSDMLMEDSYLSALKRGRFVVQISLSSMDDKLISTIDRGAPGPTRLLKMLRTLEAEGIPTSCRIQPILPTFEDHAQDVVSAAADAGVRHVAAEHLKLGVEKEWSGTRDLARALKLDLFKYFTDRRSHRIGREWTLHVEDRLETMLALRKMVRSKGMTFGAADTDLLLMSDGSCCCSGTDLLPGFEHHNRYNFLEAARIGLSTGLVSIENLAHTWVPQGSIAEHVNSHSRLPPDGGVGAGISQYIERAWNGAANGSQLTGLHGVEDTGEIDGRGFKLYRINDNWRKIVVS